MHDCPVCHEACDCDGEDHYNDAAAADCVCSCEEEDLGVIDELLDDEPACRVCGCTELSACPGGCIWAEPDLCSRCA